MKTQDKPARVWAYLNAEDQAKLEALSDGTKLQASMVLSVIIAAGLKAIAANANRFELPLQLRVGAPETPSAPPLNRNLTPVKK